MKIVAIGLGGPELLIVLVIILVLFGGTKLPKLARSLGEARRELADGFEDVDDSSSGDKAST